MAWFNLKLPSNAVEVYSEGKHIGYVWFAPEAFTTVLREQRHMATKRPRWTSCTLDGCIVSRNSRTEKEAVKALKGGIRRKVAGRTPRPP